MAHTIFKIVQIGIKVHDKHSNFVNLRMTCLVVDIGLRTIKINYDIIDPKLYVSIPNQLNQPWMLQAKIQHDVIDRPVKPVTTAITAQRKQSL